MANPVNPRYIQAQSFAIQASGASSGDTTIIVQSFKYPDGTTNIVTADLGDWCYATLEPNNGSQEEAIQFTGVTQNASGTATITGVSSVGFKYPYTVTSGLSKSHAGGATLIISNEAALYGNLVNYMNSTLASGIAPNASSTVKGVTLLSVDPAVAASPIALGQNDPTVLTQAQKNYIASVTSTAVPFAVAAGTSSAYTVTLASSISTLASGTHLNFMVPVSNATGVTLNINSLGAKPIRKNYNISLASGDVVNGEIVSATYDGATFQMVNQPKTGFLGVVGTGQTSHDLSSAASDVIPHGLGILPKLVRVTGYVGTTGQTGCQTFAVISGGVTSAQFISIDAGTNTGIFEGAAFRLYNASGGSVFTTGTVTVDATNITIAYAKTGSPTGNADIIWEAIG